MAATATANPITKKTMREEQALTLKPSAFQIAEFARSRFDAVIPAGTPFEEVCKPGFWCNVVHLLKRNPTNGQPDRTGAFIDLGTEDHAFYAKLYVRGVLERGLIVCCVGPGFDPKTGLACPIDLQTGLPWSGHKPVESDHIDLKWNVGKRGFDIIRKSDQQIVADGASFPTRELALEWIKKTSRS